MRVLEKGRRSYLEGVPRFCLTCGRKGHYSSHCPTLGPRVVRHRVHRCTECDRVGHNSRTCPELRR